MATNGSTMQIYHNLSIARYNCLEIKVVAPPLGLVVFFWLLGVVDSVITMPAACMKATSWLVLKGQSCQKKRAATPKLRNGSPAAGHPRNMSCGDRKSDMKIPRWVKIRFRQYFIFIFHWQVEKIGRPGHCAATSVPVCPGYGPPPCRTSRASLAALLCGKHPLAACLLHSGNLILLVELLFPDSRFIVEILWLAWLVDRLRPAFGQKYQLGPAQRPVREFGSTEWTPFENCGAWLWHCQISALSFWISQLHTISTFPFFWQIAQSACILSILSMFLFSKRSRAKLKTGQIAPPKQDHFQMIHNAGRCARVFDCAGIYARAGWAHFVLRCRDPKTACAYSDVDPAKRYPQPP